MVSVGPVAGPAERAERADSWPVGDKPMRETGLAGVAWVVAG